MSSNIFMYKTFSYSVPSKFCYYCPAIVLIFTSKLIANLCLVFAGNLKWCTIAISSKLTPITCNNILLCLYRVCFWQAIYLREYFFSLLLKCSRTSRHSKMLLSYVVSKIIYYHYKIYLLHFSAVDNDEKKHLILFCCCKYITMHRYGMYWLWLLICCAIINCIIS